MDFTPRMTKLAEPPKLEVVFTLRPATLPES